MRFTKMHGSGNDYIYLDGFQQPAPIDPGPLAAMMADRHFGVGGDGMVLMVPSSCGDVRMRMFNADGSEAEICGNAVRCVAKYAFDHGICKSPSMRVETEAGVVAARLILEGNKVDGVEVDMGQPITSARHIPTTLPGNPVVDAQLEIDGEVLYVTCLSMGNPHCVVFVDELSDELVLAKGPRIEVDRHFPCRVNVEFVQRLSHDALRVRTWERGSGETLACGSGACAACVAGVLTERTGRRVHVRMTGGELEVAWHQESEHVFLKGPVQEVFSGEWCGNS